MQEFNFEAWSDLHTEDPGEFDRRREEALREFIAQANPDSRQMLEQTLFTLQMHRQKSKSPLQSAIFASNLMWESFGKLRETMNEARTVFDEARPALSLVGGKQMNQIDQIVTGWAAGVPQTESTAGVTSDGQLDEDAAETANAANPVTGKSGVTSARIIAFPKRG